MSDQILNAAFNQAPTLAFAVWMVYQMKAAIDKMSERYETTAKVISTALDKSTEMLGRSIQSSTQTEALHARSLDILGDCSEQLKRLNGAKS